MFNFMKWKWLYFVLSGSVIIPGLMSLALFGLRPAIDFTGGALLEVHMNSPMPTSDEVRIIAEQVTPISQVQTTTQQTVIIRSGPLTDEQKNLVLQKLQSSFISNAVEEVRFETVGPTLGERTNHKNLSWCCVGSHGDYGLCGTTVQRVALWRMCHIVDVT